MQVNRLLVQNNKNVYCYFKVKNYESEPGVVYISHLPWGFEEKPLREYFKQFGAIKQLRLSRSKKV